jgi:hypothetical protein
VHAAYRCLGAGTLVDDRIMRLAGRYLMLFPQDPLMNLDSAIVTGEELLREGSLQAASQSLLGMSLDILRNQISPAVVSIAVPGGAATFLDLERLWELAVAQLYRRCGLGTVYLHGLRDASLRLLTRGGPAIDPDVVIRDDQERLTRVVDAKYKIIRSPNAAPASDLYQLAAYADLTGVGFASLVYLGSESHQSNSAQGHTKFGAEVSIVILSPESLILRGDAALLDLM